MNSPPEQSSESSGENEVRDTEANHERPFKLSKEAGLYFELFSDIPSALTSTNEKLPE